MNSVLRTAALHKPVFPELAREPTGSPDPLPRKTANTSLPSPSVDQPL